MLTIGIVIAPLLLLVIPIFSGEFKKFLIAETDLDLEIIMATTVESRRIGKETNEFRIPKMTSLFREEEEKDYRYDEDTTYHKFNKDEKERQSTASNCFHNDNEHRCWNGGASDYETVASVSASCDHLILGHKVKEDDRPIKTTPGDDNDDIKSIPPPENLQYSIEFDLPVGFRRLRKAMLSESSSFWSETILKGALEYKEVTFSRWDRHNNHIGLETISSTTKEVDYIGASKTTNYLLPESPLAKASKATEQAVISAYNDDYFALKKSTSTPDIPFGNRFVAHTQIIVLNTGENSSRMICSVEAEFPYGEPLGFGRSIRYGMKQGSMAAFEKIRDAILDVCPG